MLHPLAALRTLSLLCTFYERKKAFDFRRRRSGRGLNLLLCKVFGKVRLYVELLEPAIHDMPAELLFSGSSAVREGHFVAKHPAVPYLVVVLRHTSTIVRFLRCPPSENLRYLPGSGR